MAAPGERWFTISKFHYMIDENIYIDEDISDIDVLANSVKMRAKIDNFTSTVQIARLSNFTIAVYPGSTHSIWTDERR